MRPLAQELLDAFPEVFAQRPLRAVDAGAAGALPPRWQTLCPALQVLAFEPRGDEGAVVQVRGGSQRVFPCALGRAAGQGTLRINREPVTSSLLPANTALLRQYLKAAEYEQIGSVPVRIEALDDVLRREQVAGIDLLKLDTQGTELAILQGACQALQRCAAIEIEVEFIPLYQGQPLFTEVDGFLQAQGFVLFDLRPVYWKRHAGWDRGGAKGQLIWADALYLRPWNATTAPPAQDPDFFAALVRWVVAVILYGYVDLALEAVGALPPEAWAGAEAAERVDRLRRVLCARSRRRCLGPFRGRYRLAGWLHGAYKQFQYGLERGLAAERDLGNV